MKDQAELYKGYVEDLKHISDQVGMTQWEQDFVDDISRKQNYSFLSPNQKQKILSLAEKYGV